MALFQFRTTRIPARQTGSGAAGAGLPGSAFPALAVLLVFLLIIPGGCATIEQRKADFIARRNSQIGTPFSTAGLPDPIEVKSLGNGKTYYLFEDQKTGCRWSCEVDAEKGIIEYWLYEGNPNLCYY